MRPDAWRSRAGWFTLVSSPSGLEVLEIKQSDVKLIRILGGTLWDHEGFSEEVLERWKSIPGRFVQFKSYRLFVPPSVCECQKTGWKPYDDY